MKKINHEVHPSNLTDVVTLLENERDQARSVLLAISAIVNKWHNGDQTGGSSIDAMEAVSEALGKPF